MEEVALRYLKENIVKVLSKSASGMSINDIADDLKVSRHTIAKYILVLKEMGVIDQYEVGRAKLCFLKDRKGKKSWL